MNYKRKIKLLIFISVLAYLLKPIYMCYANDETDYIKWMEFDVPVSVLSKAMEYDIKSYYEETPLRWIELLAYAAAANWGNIKNSDKAIKNIDAAVVRLQAGEKMADIANGLKLYDFYLQTYSAVLSGFLGEYEIETKDSNGRIIFEKKYGLKVFSPIAKGYSYNHYDDFGDSRSYGYKRKHQGNDLMGSTGTPIIAIESGYVEAMGWNQYGGWRIGIRSLDRKRYYYYAHLQKDHPFNKKLEEGAFVQAGDVIGYLGRTGYSLHENTNNIKLPHLHFGIQIIFDEQQKDGTNQIWIDAYDIVELLNKNKMSVYKNRETNEFEPSLKINSIVSD